MGLQKSYNYKGMQIDNCYIKIVHISGNKNKLYFNLEYYVSKTIADLDINNENYLFITDMYSIVPDLNSELNYHTQMYEYLKLQSEFSEAVDV